MPQTRSLAPEWERIGLLAGCLAAHRRQRTAPADVKERLGAVQRRVIELRNRPPWQTISDRYGLGPLDFDILACVTAPAAEPRLGWLFQELQPGVGSRYPSPALIRELLVIDDAESGAFQKSLNGAGPLARSGLLKIRHGHLFAPLEPAPSLLRELLGWTVDPEPPPGSVPVDTGGSWEDLVLPAECIRFLKEFLLMVTHRTAVGQDWGGRLTGGPVALFAGPSGTGKTFAAEVLAQTLNWPLYRVDLGRIVSKYVGETEKNLNALFESASGHPMVLLFDEADSLFGKRGEIREARDRYANMEVSHLLSRIERHDGPCILTTNMRRHLDAAFARRFQAVVEFPRPDAEARRRLWRLYLPPKAPLDDGVSPDRLGDAVNLTGAQIRNAAIYAAFLAAGGGSPIGLAHVARAVRIELAKEGQEVPRSSLGFLADHLEEAYSDAQN